MARELRELGTSLRQPLDARQRSEQKGGHQCGGEPRLRDTGQRVTRRIAPRLIEPASAPEAAVEPSALEPRPDPAGESKK